MAGSILILLGALLSATVDAQVVAKRISPVYTTPFQVPLPIPAVAKAKATWTDPSTGIPIDFYQIEAKTFDHQFFPNLGSAKLVGFDGSFPGPTFRVERGRQTVVRLVNSADRNTNIHLHGSYSRSPWDGWATDMAKPGQYKDYYFPNAANARTIWYHDHAEGHNANNMYRGLAGMYQIYDPKEDAATGLPSGDKHDVPLILTAHYFTKNGDMTDESKQRTSIYGDTFLVNGQIQPYLAVEPRKYRFRVLNAAVSRVFNLAVNDDDDAAVSMFVIGSDGGLRKSPVDTESLITGMADRWEIIIDFADHAGKNLTMTTKNMFADTAYDSSYEILRFVVGDSVSDNSNNGPIPYQLRSDLLFPNPKGAAERNISFDSHMDMSWGINGQHMDDPMKRVMMRPPLGTIEKYTITSKGAADMMSIMMGGGGMGGMMGGGSRPSSGGGMMNGMMRGQRRSNRKRQMMGGMMGGMGGGMGGMSGMMGASEWTHVMHMHLVDLKIIGRSKINATKASGRDHLEPYEIGSVKDVAMLGGNEIVEILVKFAPYPGLYMFHCHNAVHEDNGMMGTFNITHLADLGYDKPIIGLEDPRDPRFAARAYTGTDLEQVKRELLPFFASLKAYPDPVKLAQAEDRYWAAKKKQASTGTGDLSQTPTIEPATGSASSPSLGQTPASPPMISMPGMPPMDLATHNSHHPGSTSTGGKASAEMNDMAGILAGQGKSGTTLTEMVYMPDMPPMDLATHNSHHPGSAGAGGVSSGNMNNMNNMNNMPGVASGQGSSGASGSGMVSMPGMPPMDMATHNSHHPGSTSTGANPSGDMSKMAGMMGQQAKPSTEMVNMPGMPPMDMATHNSHHPGSAGMENTPPSSDAPGSMGDMSGMMNQPATPSTEMVNMPGMPPMDMATHNSHHPDALSASASPKGSMDDMAGMMNGQGNPPSVDMMNMPGMPPMDMATHNSHHPDTASASTSAPSSAAAADMGDMSGMMSTQGGSSADMMNMPGMPPMDMATHNSHHPGSAPMNNAQQAPTASQGTNDMTGMMQQQSSPASPMADMPGMPAMDMATHNSHHPGSAANSSVPLASISAPTSTTNSTSTTSSSSSSSAIMVATTSGMPAMDMATHNSHHGGGGGPVRASIHPSPEMKTTIIASTSTSKPTATASAMNMVGGHGGHHGHGSMGSMSMPIRRRRRVIS